MSSSRRLWKANRDYLKANGWTKEKLLADPASADGRIPKRGTLDKLFDGAAVSKGSLVKLAAYTGLDLAGLIVTPEDDGTKPLLQAIERSMKKLKVETPLGSWMGQEVLRGATDALEQLVKRRPTQSIPEILFLHQVQQLLVQLTPGTSIYAVCGKKSWERSYVSVYFNTNYEFTAKLWELEQAYPALAKRTRLTRIFIEPAGGVDPLEKKVIDEHAKHADIGVRPLVVPRERHQDIDATVPALTKKLFKEGFGVILIDREPQSVALTHIKDRKTKGERVFVAQYDSPQVIRVIRNLFDGLSAIAEPYLGSEETPQVKLRTAPGAGKTRSRQPEPSPSK